MRIIAKASSLYLRIIRVSGWLYVLCSRLNVVTEILVPPGNFRPWATVDVGNLAKKNHEKSRVARMGRADSLALSVRAVPGWSFVVWSIKQQGGTLHGRHN